MDDLFAFRNGQDCEIFKATRFERSDDIIYIPDLALNLIPVTEPANGPEDVEEIVGCCYTGNDFVDYTDASDHDGALIGTWWTTAYASDGTAANFTMTIGKKGKVRFTAQKIDIDNTTTCTTKNGHVAFDIYLTQGTGSRSYIYVREKDRIVFYNENNAQSAWVWQKEE